MSFQTVKPAVGLSTVNSLTTHASTIPLTYRSDARITGGSATKSLTHRIWYPTVADPKIPRPLVLWFNVANFAVSGAPDQPAWDAIADIFTKSGAVFCLVETRVEGDTPVEPEDGDLGLTTNEGRTVNAILEDAKASTKYLQGVRHSIGSAVCVEPKWTFLAGNSSGIISGGLCLVLKHLGGLEVAGVIAGNSAYGVDALSGYTAAIRTENGYTEAALTANHPPICAFLGGADVTLGLTNVSNYKAKLEALGGDNIVHYDAVGDHFDTGIQLFDETKLNGADTREEAIHNFMSARITAIPRSSSMTTLV